MPYPAGLVSSHSSPSSGRVPWLHRVSIRAGHRNSRSPRIEFLLTEQKTGGMRKPQPASLVPGDICSGSLGGCHIWITIVVTLFFSISLLGFKTPAFPPVSRREGCLFLCQRLPQATQHHPLPPTPRLISFFAVFIKWNFFRDPPFMWLGREVQRRSSDRALAWLPAGEWDPEL